VCRTRRVSFGRGGHESVGGRPPQSWEEKASCLGGGRRVICVGWRKNSSPGGGEKNVCGVERRCPARAFSWGIAPEGEVAPCLEEKGGAPGEKFCESPVSARGVSSRPEKREAQKVFLRGRCLKKGGRRVVPLWEKVWCPPWERDNTVAGGRSVPTGPRCWRVCCARAARSPRAPWECMWEPKPWERVIREPKARGNLLWRPPSVPSFKGVKKARGELQIAVRGPFRSGRRCGSGPRRERPRRQQPKAQDRRPRSESPESQRRERRPKSREAREARPKQNKQSKQKQTNRCRSLLFTRGRCDVFCDRHHCLYHGLNKTRRQQHLQL